MKIFKILSGVVVLVFLSTSCLYNFIVPEEPLDPTDPDTPDISFSSEIVPIFEAKCTACHSTGNQAPDLTSGNAFNSINSSRYIDSSNPAASLIYTKASPDGDHIKYTEAEAALVLTWITQGAQNN